MKVIIKPPVIPEDEKSPLVLSLSDIVEHQAAIIQQMAEEIQRLKDEIARLKGQPPKPKIRPSSLEKTKKRKSKSSRKKRPGSRKRSKTAELKIHKTKPIEPEKIPAGSEFKYYKDFVVQDIKIEPCNTRFRLKVYETPDGGYVTGELPAHLNGRETASGDKGESQHNRADEASKGQRQRRARRRHALALGLQGTEHRSQRKPADHGRSGRFSQHPRDQDVSLQHREGLGG